MIEVDLLYLILYPIKLAHTARLTFSLVLLVLWGYENQNHASARFTVSVTLSYCKNNSGSCCQSSTRDNLFKGMLQKIAWEELCTLSGQVEMFLLQSLEAEGHLRKESKNLKD
jgi:hypothetical protein